VKIPEFELTIWVKPHHGWGYLVYLDTDSILMQDFGLQIHRQSLEFVTSRRSPEFLLDSPHETVAADREWALRLASKLDRISYALSEHHATPMLGGTFFGILLKRGFQEVKIEWLGQFSDQAADLCDLWTELDQAFSSAIQPPASVDGPPGPAVKS
jgi:hypothetical protein